MQTGGAQEGGRRRTAKADGRRAAKAGGEAGEIRQKR